MVNVTVKRKIRYNGKEYSSPGELPPEVRAAYDKALHEAPAKINFVVNGEQFGSEVEMPAGVRRLCDDVMNVIDNNGEVTIPNGGKTEPLLSKKEIAVVAIFTGGIIALVLARLAFG